MIILYPENEKLEYYQISQIKKFKKLMRPDKGREFKEYKNICYLINGYPYTVPRYKKIKEIIQDLCFDENKITSSRVIIDLSEGPSFNPVIYSILCYLNDILKNNNCKLTYNINNIAWMPKQSDANSSNIKFNISRYSYFIRSFIDENIGIRSKIKDKQLNPISYFDKKPFKLICLNNKVNAHRIAAIFNICDIKRDHISFLSLHKFVPEQWVDILSNKFSIQVKDFSLLSHKNIIKKEYCNSSFQLSKSVFYQGWEENLLDFFLVTETEMTDGRIMRVTEKFLKPILLKNPFIILGNPCALSLIREMGFKTFSPYINESYDFITDPKERFNSIRKEVNRISSLDSSGLIDLKSNLNHIIEYNFEYFFNDFNNFYHSKYERNIFN